ncbi:hypothetical protein OQH60_06635 [Campylobacter sp. MIT 21-1685]|uniref:hypothetical protein n=1 Tax=unclassified Campylobacter TaxID=2593542 RepID=UPI00224AB961|nr:MULTISPECIES: hypothetical protein [unclassified Campylobacter]MCX2683540.1 hypothetical protein [Campylobacter sp. MIT 21-1684]MCX2751799.1 hypothetical protein [Campylobacter sp. MIT 21-1682]MCX2808024.1 hypothetical protein [Campylobacter sp. MIT 21-1685]
MMTISMLSNIDLEYYKKQNIANPSSDNKVTNEEKDKIVNSFLRAKDYYEELGNTIPVLEGSYEYRLRKGEMSQTELNSLFEWMDKNTTGIQWNDGYDEEYIKIFHTSKNANELKQKWLEFQAKQEAKTQDFTKKMQEQVHKELRDNNQNTSVNSTSTTKDNQTKQTQETKPFKPIQTESKSQTYKDDNTRNELVKKLLENKFGKSQELELLFGMKLSDDDTGEFNKILSQNTTSRIVDLKA